MLIYLDMNIYNRSFDDKTQLRIRFETMAIDIIFQLIEKGRYELCWSFMLDHENSMNPYESRKNHIGNLKEISNFYKEAKPEILEVAKYVVESTSSRIKDALHLACAIDSGSAYFITCDDKFIRTIIRNRNTLKDRIDNIKLVNPIDFVREEMNIDVIE